MKFYDANQYFSKYLLFAKTDAETVRTRVFAAFKDYLNLYWQMLESATPLTDLRGHSADCQSAERLRPI